MLSTPWGHRRLHLLSQKRSLVSAVGYAPYVKVMHINRISLHVHQLLTSAFGRRFCTITRKVKGGSL